MTTTPPDLDSAYPLSQEQIDTFQRDGHIILRQVCTREEIEAYRPAILGAADEFLRQARPMGERDVYGKAFLQIMHLCYRDETVHRFVMAKRFAKIAADLMGIDRVRLYHDQILFKEPGGGHTPWHQDHFYIPLDTTKVLTMWLPLVDVSAAMGTMSFASGSHREGQLVPLGTSVESDAGYKQVIAERGWPVHASGDIGLGDISFHYTWTVHCAAPNTSDSMREAMTILYFEDGARLQKHNSTMFEGPAALHLGGRGEGELADSERNPIVFER